MKLSLGIVIGALGASLVHPGAFVRSDAPGATEPKRDSGRYSLSAACSRDEKWLNCQVSMRDLVYDNVLVPERKVSATLDGGLGSSVQFEGRPAQGAPQRVTLAVGMVDGSPKPDVARLVIQLHEGDHLVQDYVLTFPVAKPAN
jgi:hypothetical protein